MSSNTFNKVSDQFTAGGLFILALTLFVLIHIIGYFISTDAMDTNLHGLFTSYTLVQWIFAILWHVLSVFVGLSWAFNHLEKTMLRHE